MYPVSTKILSSTAVFNIDHIKKNYVFLEMFLEHQITGWFHFTLKNGQMAALNSALLSRNKLHFKLY